MNLPATFWGDVLAIDEWLDAKASRVYQDQPLAQDWARVAKCAEEAGEAVDAMNGRTGQNPRKGFYATREDMLGELADVAWTAIFAIQHFTKNIVATEDLLAQRLEKIRARVPTN